MNTNNYFSKHVVPLAMLLLMLLAGTNAMAQNVTIKATNGSTIPARKNGGAFDTFFRLGGFATWQHEQLSMVLTVSDGTKLTQNGQLDNPANNLFKNGNYIQIGKGQVSNANVCYVSLSLPKGFRFTGYTIKFTKPRNAQGQEFNTGNNNTEQSTFGETNSTFSDYITEASIYIGGSGKEITRNEKDGSSFSNILYFKLEGPSDSRALIQLESAEFFFTAEENYSPVMPTTSFSNRSAVDIPFSTSKVDYGRISNEYYYGKKRISYSSANVKDVDGKMVLYEAESTKNGSDIDGISGKVVDYKTGTISSANTYFKLGRKDKEQVYYIETPTYVELSDGTKNPVGYRIVAADIDYATSVTTRTFYITYTYYGYTYYLYTNGSNVGWISSEYSEYATRWTMDADGYIGSPYGYLYFNNGYAAVQSSKPGPSERFDVNENGIYQKEWPDYYIRFYYADAIISKDYGENATYKKINEDGESVDNFKLMVYDKEGENPDTINVTKNGTYPLRGLNNDAVKFGVQGIGLVRATLTLQALDPYLDEMSVVCQDEVQTGIRMDQPFTASDFSVNGGEFYFYLPKDCENHQVAITFEDLKSKYFDESYTGGSSKNTSRINFVKSEHYNVFGTTDNVIYNDTAEAKNAQKDRLSVGIVGTKAFKFNNAEDVGKTGGTLTEYPFSLQKYKNSPNNGDFKEMTFKVTTEDQQLTRYVFTTDETRYNIAPTTATQHRAYAYYKMIVHVQTGTYQPKVEFKKIYDNTFYGTGQNKKFYGAVVTAKDGNGKEGYSSAAVIFDRINTIITKDKKDDSNHTDIPASADQILYLDFSQMAGVYNSGESAYGSMDNIAATFAKNCMVFLPKGSSNDNDNMAYKMESGNFQAANNIVITDKQPFYSPYDIQLHAERQAKYTREITIAKNGKVQSASMILPFELTVDGEGKHTNADGSISFKLHKMKATDCLLTEKEEDWVYFPDMEDVKETTANTPYLVEVLNVSDKDNIIFEASQKGARIVKTTDMDASAYTFEGESSKGTADKTSYTFKHYGSYAGKTLAIGGHFYYFSRDKFVCSDELDARYQYAKIFPFRCYYAASGGSSTPAKLLASFNIMYGTGDGNESLSTGIDDAKNEADMLVKTDRGTITITATAEKDVRIDNLGGMSVNKVHLNAGETKSIQVPAGIYIINGTKIQVR